MTEPEKVNNSLHHEHWRNVLMHSIVQEEMRHMKVEYRRLTERIRYENNILRRLVSNLGGIAVVLLATLLCGCSTPKQVVKPVTVAPMPQAMQGMSASQQAKVILHGCTNCPAPVQIVVNGVFYLHWNASLTPNVSYQVAETTNLYRPFFIAGTTTNLYWKVYATNAMGLFKVRAINSQGLVSIWAT